MRRSPDRAGEKPSDTALKDRIGGQPDCVFVALSFQELIDFRVSERSVTLEVARPQGAPLQIAELLEYEQRAIGRLRLQRPFRPLVLSSQGTCAMPGYRSGSRHLGHRRIAAAAIREMSDKRTPARTSSAAEYYLQLGGFYRYQYL
jgi:hypothetical protein